MTGIGPQLPSAPAESSRDSVPVTARERSMPLRSGQGRLPGVPRVWWTPDFGCSIKSRSRPGTLVSGSCRPGAKIDRAAIPAAPISSIPGSTTRWLVPVPEPLRNCSGSRLCNPLGRKHPDYTSSGHRRDHMRVQDHLSDRPAAPGQNE
jgi:hypothetical protein